MEVYQIDTGSPSSWFITPPRITRVVAKAMTLAARNRHIEFGFPDRSLNIPYPPQDRVVDDMVSSPVIGCKGYC